MFKSLSTDIVNKILIIGVLLVIIEIAFFNGGLIFSVFFSGLLIYIGWKKYPRLWAKIFFWMGAISLVITILNMMAVRFILVAGIVLFFINYYRSKKDRERITPQFFPEAESMDQEPLMKVDPLFRLQFFGDQKTSESVYQWRDINIHGGYGNRMIDLSNTVLLTLY
jgi:lia operon protein LiaF